MHATENKDNFNQELHSVLEQMDNRIETLSEMVSFQNGNKTDDKLSTLNKLKLHRYKVKETLKTIESIDESSWQQQKDIYLVTFKEAEDLLH